MVGATVRSMRNCTLREINKRALRALLRALGPTGTVRFLRHLGGGGGEYTKERHKWLDALDVEDVMKDIRSLRKRRVPHRTGRQARR